MLKKVFGYFISSLTLLIICLFILYSSFPFVMEKIANEYFKKNNIDGNIKVYYPTKNTLGIVSAQFTENNNLFQIDDLKIHLKHNLRLDSIEIGKLRFVSNSLYNIALDQLKFQGNIKLLFNNDNGIISIYTPPKHKIKAKFANSRINFIEKQHSTKIDAAELTITKFKLSYDSNNKNITAFNLELRSTELKLNTLLAKNNHFAIEFTYNPQQDLSPTISLATNILNTDFVVDAFQYDAAKQQNIIPIKISNLDLAKLSTLLELDDTLQVTGNAFGTIPLLINNELQPRIENATITNTANTKGMINYTAPANTETINENLASSIHALKNFTYNTITIICNQNNTDHLLINIYLKGTTPNVADGQEIEFNISITEKLSNLIKKITAAY